MKSFIISLGLIFIFPSLFSQSTNFLEEERRKYEALINQHPYRTRPQLSPSDWKAIPKKDRPDLAWEHDFILTMDPALGYVPKEELFEVNKYVKDFFQMKPYGAIPGINWMERGPNNIGGRTRAIMFDPNDGTNKKVWAGGVTGGLWYNEEITSASSAWVKVNDLWENISITSIVNDPTNPQVFYVGTGEGWGAGSGRGAGIWKSTDGGATWNQLVITTDYYYINDLAVRDESGTGVLYAAVAQTFYKGAFHGTTEGLFRSSDGGTSFSQVLPDIFGIPYQAADIEIGADNRIYIGTRRNADGNGGGTILYSDNGTNGSWTVVNAYSGILAAGRVEIACAPSDANIVYAMIEANNTCERIVQSTNKGASWVDKSEPVDVDNGIPDTDFTRGQAWYDFILAVDPNNSSIVYAGGVDLFRSTNSAGDWSHISKWSNNNFLATLNCSEVHADHHAIVFVPGSSSSAVFGNDGGVYYTSDLANAAIMGVIFPRNNGYNVTQFYSCASNPHKGSDNFLAGAQDNGTQRFNAPGVNSTTEATGGDGGFCFIDQDNPAYQITSYVYNNYYRSSNTGETFPTTLSSANDGTFINPSDYDDRENILYSGKSATSIQRITSVIGTPSVGSVAIALGTGASHIRVSPYAPVGTSSIFIGTTGGRVFKMVNAHGPSPTITDITGNIAIFGAVSCIEIGASENDLLVTFSNYGIVSIWLTNNGGINWANKEGNLPNMPVRWALFNPHNPKQVLLATEVGAWSTDDISVVSPDWQPTNSNFANVRVDMLQYRASDNLITAATHGRGLYTTYIGPTADFSANVIYTYKAKAVTFTDKSMGATSWSWNFGPGANPAVAITAGPHNVTYSSAGKKTVTLIINNGVASKTITDYIHVIPDKSVPYLPANGGDFESNSLDFVVDSISNTQFQKGNSSIAGKNGVTSGSNAWITGLTASNYSNNSLSILYTPNFNFSTSGTYTIQFRSKYAFEALTDGYRVEYSIDKGSTWTILGTLAAGWYNSTTTPNSTTFPANTPFFSGTTLNAYETKSLDISFLQGNADVAFRLVFKSNASATDVGGAIDDFQITGPPDITPPTVSALSPADNATGVAVNANLVITFNENVQKGTGNILVKESGVITQTIDVTSGSVTVSGTTVTVNPNDFSPGAAVNIEIAAGAIRDISGNNYAGITNGTDWNFNVADLTAPLATAFSPADNATGVSVNANLVITFNENVQKGTGNILIKESGIITQTIDVTSGSVTVSGTTVTVNLNNFSPGAAVNIEIAAGAIRDISGNNYAGITNGTDWNFNVADASAPQATAFSPADNATGVAVNANLVITFNENVQKGIGNILIKESGVIIQTIDVTSGGVTVSGATVTVNPDNFSSGAAVNIEIAAGTIRDMSDNNYVGITNGTDWNFSVTDVTAPLATTFSPADNATGVAVNANLVITFNENVQKGTGNILIKESGVIIQTINVISGNVTVSGATVTVNPNDFSPGAAVNIEIAAGAIRDMSGNNYAGITDPTIWNFSVADASAPLATAFSPAENATGVAENANLVITFNENVQKGTGNILIKESGVIIQTIDVTSGSVTVSGATVTVNPNDFSSGAAVNIEIAAGAIRDVSGNNYAGITNATNWNFSVADVTAPLATTFSPADNTIGVSVNINLIITFNENVQKGTGNILIKESGVITQTINVTSGNVTVAGTTVTVNPNDFSPGAAVNIEIAAGAIRDISGNSYAGITNATNWSFNVADASAPLATAFSPADNATGVAENANLVITFNENVQKGTGNILIKESGIITQTIDITSGSVTVSGATVTVNPNDFSPGTAVNIEIAAGAIRDISGNNYAGITNGINWNFGVADASAPLATILSPANNATGVAVDASLVITFNETVQKGTGNILIKESGIITQTIDVTSASVAVSGATLTINPDDFSSGAAVNIEIAAGAIRDILGNDYAGITNTTDWSFGVITVTEIEENIMTKNNISVYPNPNSGLFILTLKDHEPLKNISMYSIAGKEALILSIYSNVPGIYRVITENLAFGVYFLKVETEKGLDHVKMAIVK